MRIERVMVKDGFTRVQERFSGTWVTIATRRSERKRSTGSNESDCTNILCASLSHHSFLIAAKFVGKSTEPGAYAVPCEAGCRKYLWDAVKRYLRRNCDYTLATLQENLPKALESMSMEAIWKWEYRMSRWVDAHDGGMGPRNVQLHAQKFTVVCMSIAHFRGETLPGRHRMCPKR